MTKREKMFYEKWNWSERSVDNCPDPEKCTCLQWIKDTNHLTKEVLIIRDGEITTMHMEMVVQEAEDAGVIL